MRHDNTHVTKKSLEMMQNVYVYSKLNKHVIATLFDFTCFTGNKNENLIKTKRFEIFLICPLE